MPRRWGYRRFWYGAGTTTCTGRSLERRRPTAVSLAVSLAEGTVRIRGGMCGRYYSCPNHVRRSSSPNTFGLRLPRCTPAIDLGLGSRARGLRPVHDAERLRRHLET
jgi:hypothetical protein